VFRYGLSVARYAINEFRRCKQTQAARAGRSNCQSDTTHDIMNTSGKRLAQMRANPKDDWRVDELETVAIACGMKVRKSGGSHVVFSHPAATLRVTVPARRPVKPVYIRQFVELVDEIQGTS
jgi:predicted RNA binding protein YcfA (HicA-like mRNA interferase family)